MEDLFNYVSEKAKLPLSTAKIVTSTTLEYLNLNSSPLLKSSVEILLQYPNLSEAEKDILIASRVLFPENPPDTGPLSLDG